MTAATAPEERWRLGYRPALDGLRGVAIALVLIGHARLPGLSAAATVGVTLFFVLSGFLITSLLLEERERTGRIDLLGFYKRRARRLLPGLFVFLAVIGGVYVLGGVGDRVAGVILPPLFYYANWHVVLGGNLPLVGHTWSLAVEEQFYIVWPLLLIGAVALTGYRRLALVGGSLAAAIAIVRFALWDPANADRVARATDMRADALLAGCVVAFLFAIRPRVIPRWAMLAGTAAVGASMLMHGGGLRYTLLLLLVAVGGAILVAWAATRPAPLLSWRPLVWLGGISYSLYLWQTPAMSIARRVIEPEPLGVVVGILAALTLAITSTRYVERPFLRRRSGHRHDANEYRHVVPRRPVTSRHVASPRADEGPHRIGVRSVRGSQSASD